MVIEHLTDQGVGDEPVFARPSTDLAPTGPRESSSMKKKVTRLFVKIQAMNDSAVA